MKKSSKYRYMSGQMYEHHGTRLYDFGNERLPSVTIYKAVARKGRTCKSRTDQKS